MTATDYDTRARQIIKQIGLLTLEVNVTLHSLKFCVESLLREYRRPLPAEKLSEIDSIKIDVGGSMQGLAQIYDDMLKNKTMLPTK